MSEIIYDGTSAPSGTIDPNGWYVPPSTPPDTSVQPRPTRQSLLNMYKDFECTQRISEHWDDTRDSNPITPDRSIIVPFAGVIESNIITAYLKCAPGFRTEELVTISIDDIYRTTVSENTANRWMISTNPYLDGEFWSNTIYLIDNIANIPIPIYIRARTMGPPHTSFIASRDAIAPDVSVHLLIHAKIVKI